MSVLVVAILLAQAFWFWPTFPGGDWVCSEQLIPAQTHLHHLALHHHCFCPRFNTCWSSQSEESLMIFLFSERKPSAHMPYAWMFLDMAVTWAIQKLPISNQPLGMGCMATTKSMNLWSTWDGWIEADLIRHHTPQREILITNTEIMAQWLETLRGRLWKPRMIRASVDTRWYEYIMWIYTSCWGNRVTEVLGNWWKQCTFAVLSWRPLGQYACLHKSNTRNNRTKIICSLLFHAVA